MEAPPCQLIHAHPVNIPPAASIQPTTVNQNATGAHVVLYSTKGPPLVLPVLDILYIRALSSGKINSSHGKLASFDMGFSVCYLFKRMN